MNDQPLTLVADARFDRAEAGRFTLSLAGGGDRFHLDEAALVLIGLFDGVRTLPEVEQAARSRGLRWPPGALEGLAEALARAGLLVPAADLPLETVPGLRVTCTRCGNCCHLPVGPLPDADVARILGLDWAAAGETAPVEPTVRRAGEDAWLAQTDDGACVFLEPDRLCRIHRCFGAEHKPDACRLYPLSSVRRAGRLLVGLAYDCPGLGEATVAGTSLAEAAAEIEPIIRLAYGDYPVLPAMDAGGRLAEAMDGASGPEEALRGLAAAALGLVDEGTLGFSGLLRETERLVRVARDTAASPWLRRQQEGIAAVLGDERMGAPLPPVALAAGRPPLSDYYLGFLRNRVFLGEPMGRLGVAAGLAVLVMTWLLARRAARVEARSAGRTEVTLEDAAAGLALAVAAGGALDRIDELANAGGACLREALGRL